MDVRKFQIWWNDFMQLATLSDICRITKLCSFINFSGNCSCWTWCTLDIANAVASWSSVRYFQLSGFSSLPLQFQIFLSLTAYICLRQRCKILIIPANSIAELNNFRKKKKIERQQGYLILNVSQAEIHFSVWIQPHPMPWPRLWLLTLLHYISPFSRSILQRECSWPLSHSESQSLPRTC